VFLLPEPIFSQLLSRRIKSRTSIETAGRPGCPRRIFHVQNSPNPLRRQAITVSCVTITNAQRQSVQTLPSQAQKNRSTAVNFGRFFAERWSTPIWWRRARFSSCSAVQDLSSDERAAANTGSTLNIERRNWRRMRNSHLLR
jgi:hypothetical protein